MPTASLTLRRCGVQSWGALGVGARWLWGLQEEAGEGLGEARARLLTSPWPGASRGPSGGLLEASRLRRALPEGGAWQCERAGLEGGDAVGGASGEWA